MKKAIVSLVAICLLSLPSLAISQTPRREKQVRLLLSLLVVFLSLTDSGCLSTIAANVEAETIKVTAQPQLIYVEKGASGQYLNFDFVVENRTDKPLRISKLELSVYGREDKLLFQKFLDSNGFSPSIQIIPDREVAAKQFLLVFNPFDVFGPDMELKKLRYEFTFESASQGKTFRAEVIVAPVYYQPKTSLVLPVKGRLLVFDGHDFYAHHRRFNYLHPAARQIGFTSNFMRYAEDFVIINEAGEKLKGDEGANDSFFGFGAPVYATGSGRVAALFDAMPDNRTHNEAELATRPMTLYGNHVVIDHGNGEYSMFAHLKQGSVKVKLGEMIRQGQQIARVGASGSAFLPHLHYELRTGSDMKVDGLPNYFSNFRRVLGSKVVNVGQGPVETGEIVERQ